MQVTVVAFDAAAAVSASRLWHSTRSVGLSLADRACLALANDVEDGIAVTADRVWAKLDLDARVFVIR